MALTVGLWCAAAMLLLLAVPIHVHVAVDRERRIQARVRLSWLYGLVRFRLHPRPARARPTPKKERPPRPPRRLGARIARRAGKHMLHPGLRARSFGFLQDVLKAVRPRDVHLHARIGMDDPADTGLLWALFGPLGALLSARDVRLEPSFGETCLRFRAAARVRLIPVQLLFLILAFLVSPPVVRTLIAR